MALLAAWALLHTPTTSGRPAQLTADGSTPHMPYLFEWNTVISSSQSFNRYDPARADYVRIHIAM